MKPFLRTFCSAAVVGYLTATMSGCAINGNHSFTQDLSDEDTQEIPTGEFADSGHESHDQELQSTETDMCLDQELVALSNTGVWNTSASPRSIQLPEQVLFDFPIVLNKQVEMYLDLFQNEQRNQFSRWLARSSRYHNIVSKEFKEAGLPEDLFYLAMIESGFMQRACSKAKAVGMWQFMRGTARQYDLTIDRYIDERRDVIKSTQAAANYLSDLYDEFGDWHLAVAAYNGGPGTIRNGLRRYNVDNFWDLAGERYLSLETKRYVPKLIAAMMIARQPEKYGFTDIAYESPLDFETIKVSGGMSVEAIALAAATSPDTIKDLNQELLSNRTPSNVGKYEVKVPQASAELAAHNIERLHKVVSTGYKTHVIRSGETLSQICRKYDINKTTLLKVNNLRSPKLVAGRNLRIPYSTITYRLLPKDRAEALAAYKDELVLHRINPGDTISRIAHKYNVPARMIVEWNGLKNENAIRAGQQLALFIQDGSKKSGRNVSSSTIVAQNKTTGNAQLHLNKGKTKNRLPEADPLKSSETESTALFQKQNRKLQISSTESDLVLRASKQKNILDAEDAMYHWYSVKNGDSIWTISRRFSTTPSEIKRWNNLKSNLIHPGAVLKLKKV